MGIGESLGFLIEGQSARQCAEFATHALAQTDPPWLERGDYSFGQYATDTQLARELARSLIACHGFTPVDYSLRISALFQSGYCLAPENATWRAAERLATGMVWAQVGEPAPAAGNGAVARAAPIGLSFKTARFRSGAAKMQAEITHHDPRAQAAAVVFAEAVFLAATLQELRPRQFLNVLADIAEPLDPRLASSTRTLDRALGVPLADAVPFVARAGFAADDGYPAASEITGFATSSLLWALQSFLRAPDDPEAVLAMALSGGGTDTGSLGAMGGALVGARVGFTGLGPRLQVWSEQLNDHGTDGRDVLAALARDIVNR
jgi:ADP-ribosylglycohydrolase